MNAGKSGIRIGWMRRLKVALGAASRLVYLHYHADPEIIHRDIKSSNILLDGYLNAKVTDFGISKLLVYGGGTTTFFDFSNTEACNIKKLLVITKIGNIFFHCCLSFKF